MPSVAWEIAVAERFGMWPADVRRKPADEVWELMEVLAVEAEMGRLTAGLGDDEVLYDEDDDGDDPLVIRQAEGIARRADG